MDANLLSTSHLQPSSHFSVFHSDLFRSGMAERDWLSLVSDKDPTVQPVLIRSQKCPESYEITTMLCLDYRKVFTYWKKKKSILQGEVLLYWCCTDRLRNTAFKRTHKYEQQEEKRKLCFCLNFADLVWDQSSVFSSLGNLNK